MPIVAGVNAPQLTDEEYALVAAVAEREAWDDLSRPPAIPAAPRTLAEQAAVLRFAACLPAPPRRTGMDPRHARLLMLALGALGLLACWLVSPERTAVGLLVVGVFCLAGLRRRRRGGRTALRPRRPWPA